MRRLVLSATLCCVTLAPARAGVRTVWAVNDGEKVDRDDLVNPNKTGNSAWDGRAIKLFGARNEVLSFQVIVEADSRGISRLAASLPRLVRKDGKVTISYGAPASDPSLYAGRPIQVFTENYMHVTSATLANYLYLAGSPSAPKNPMGWKPVQLVPENARLGSGGLPLKVDPRSNAALWFDIYVDRTLPAGFYEGVVSIEADGEKRALPVRLEVFGFTLPDENSMHAMIYFEESQVGLYHGRDLEAAYRRFAHRQRVEFVGANDEASVRADIARFDGSAFTKAHGYAGPGEGSGDKIVPASFYDPGSCCDKRAAAWAYADDWMNFLDKTVPGAITFLYMPDEPRPANYPRILRIAHNIHSDPGPGRRLPIFVTSRFAKELEGAVDIWDAPPQGYDTRRALLERSHGHDYWVYNGGRPALGAILIDAPATDARASIWACFKQAIKVFFYWHADHWRHNGQSPTRSNQDVWEDPVTFDTRNPAAPTPGDTFANGAGVLIYPGEEKLHPARDRGVAGPCSTIQMANLRRGLQDHQYLTLARKLGLSDLVDEALAKIVPRVFSEAGKTVGFSESGNDYEAQRYRLAAAIARAQLRAPASHR